MNMVIAITADMVMLLTDFEPSGTTFLLCVFNTLNVVLGSVIVIVLAIGPKVCGFRSCRG
jgi:hypothetical protein